MNEDQLYDAAEREMDLYRAEITRITAARDEYRDNAVLHVRERDEARDQLRETAADNIRLREERDELRDALDEATRTMLNLGTRPAEVNLAHRLRKDAGLAP